MPVSRIEFNEVIELKSSLDDENGNPSKRKTQCSHTDVITMRIAKSLLVEPGKNFWYGTLAVALSVFVFAYSTNFGFLSILVFYGLWLPLILVDYRKAIGNYAQG